MPYLRATIHDDTLRVRALLEQSRDLLQEGKYDSVQECTEVALKLSQKHNYHRGIATAYNTRGNMYYYQSNYPEALKNYFAALKVNEQTGDKKYLANCYIGIGNVYFQQHSHEQALKNYKTALAYKEEAGDKRGIAYVYGNLSNVYYYMGRYRQSLDYQFTALKINEEISDKEGMTGAHNNIGYTYLLEKKYDSALLHLFAALKLSQEIDNRQVMPNIYLNIGDVYVKQQKISDGKKWIEKARSLAMETGSIEDVADAYESLSYADSVSGDFKSAYNNYRMYKFYKDSLNSEDNTKKTVEQQLRYDFYKKQVADSVRNAEAQKVAAVKLQKQRTLTYAGLAGVVALLLFIFFIGKSNRLLAKEKQKSEKLLLNILPGEIAHELKETGASKAKHHSDVTVLFTDFIDFTVLSEHLSAEQVVNEIDRCFKAFDAIIHKHGMEKIKTIGDAYMAAAGLPLPDDNHAINAVKAAIEMNEFINSLPPIINGRKLQMRAGINSGPVVAGIVGVKKFAYDIWGDTVNTAARLEHHSEAGRINISGSTYELVKTTFECVHRGKIMAKNKGEIDMYFVNA